MSQTATKTRGIPDIQGSIDTRHLAINKVGIKDIAVEIGVPYLVSTKLTTLYFRNNSVINAI